MSKTMRVTQNSFERLIQLEEETGKSKQDLIELAIEELSRKLFFNKLNKEVEKLKKNKKEWDDYLKESKEWESINDIESNDDENKSW